MFHIRSNLRFAALIIAGTCSSVASAALISPTLNWEAQLDTTNNGFWESTVNNSNSGTATRWDFTVAGSHAPNSSGPASNFEKVTQWYSFPNDRAEKTDWAVDIPGGGTDVDGTNEDVTWEIVFRLSNLTGDHVIFDTGGNGLGTVFKMEGDTLTFRVQSATDNAARTVEKSFTFTDADIGKFHQFIATVDVSGTAGSNSVSLWHNASQVGTAMSATGVLNDWDGGDDAGLGEVGQNSVAGTPNSGGGNPGPNGVFSNFDGDIAIMRYWRGTLLEQADVDDQFAQLVPEPSTYIVFTGLILCFGLAGWWRKRAG